MADRHLPVGQVLVMTTVTQSLNTMASLALTAVAPKAAFDLGVSPALIGYQVGLIFLGAMSTALLGGGLVRRFGAARTGQLSLWGVATGSAISALGTLPALTAGALALGLGYGLMNPAASHLLARAPTARNMNLIFSIKQCGVPLGGMLAGLLVPPVTLALDWRAALAACAVLGAGWSLVLGFKRRAWDGDRDPKAPVLAAPLESLRLVWNIVPLRWVAMTSALYTIIQLCVTGFLVTYLVIEVGLDLVLAGTLLAATHAAGAAGRLIWGWVADRLKSGTLTMAAIGVLGIAGALGTGAVASDWPVWLIGAVLAFCGFCVMGWNGVFFAVVARLSPPQSVGLATGGAIAIGSLAAVLGPAVFAAFHDHLGLSYGGGYAALALVSALGVACVFQARRRPA